MKNDLFEAASDCLSCNEIERKLTLARALYEDLRTGRLQPGEGEPVPVPAEPALKDGASGPTGTRAAIAAGTASPGVP